MHSGSGNLSLETPWVILTYNILFASERYTLSQNLRDYRIKPYTDHSVVRIPTFQWKKTRFAQYR